MATTTTKASKDERAKERGEWLALVNELLDEIESWAVARKWPTHREKKPAYESELGKYTLPVLTILAPTGPIRVDPVARFVAGADGRVDLLGWPTMNRMRLIRQGDAWVMKPEYGMKWRGAWGEGAFARLVERLNPAA
jgi:hypothetical protein